MCVRVNLWICEFVERCSYALYKIIYSLNKMKLHHDIYIYIYIRAKTVKQKEEEESRRAYEIVSANRRTETNTHTEEEIIGAEGRTIFRCFIIFFRWARSYFKFFATFRLCILFHYIALRLLIFLFCFFILVNFSSFSCLSSFSLPYAQHIECGFLWILHTIWAYFMGHFHFHFHLHKLYFHVWFIALILFVDSIA